MSIMLTAVAELGDAEQKTCFVAMPVSTPVSYADDLRDVDHFGHVLKHLFTPALEQAGYTVIPPKMLGAALIHAEIIRHLEQADLVLADLSNHNPNVFFELGIRTSLNRPVVLIKDARTTMIPFDLGTINVLTYDESLAPWTLDEEIKRLAEHVSNVATDDSSGNAIWHYFGLTKRGGPAEAGSLEAKVDLLLAEITKLRLAPEASGLPPIVSSTLSARYLTVSVDTTATTPAIGVSFSYDWGDGSTSTTPSHTYARAGTYTVKVTATNSAGTSTATRSVTMEAPPSQPVGQPA